MSEVRVRESKVSEDDKWVIATLMRRLELLVTPVQARLDEALAELGKLRAELGEMAKWKESALAELGSWGDAKECGASPEKDIPTSAMQALRGLQAERDELRRQLKAAKSDVATYLAREQAATEAGTASGDASLEMLMRWLHATSREMVAGRT